VQTVVRRIVDRGEQPFLHVAVDNAGAVGLYERLGLVTHRRVRFHGYRTPVTGTPEALAGP
jgi:predicted GNAT family acetyltransferase